MFILLFLTSFIFSQIEEFNLSEDEEVLVNIKEIDLSKSNDPLIVNEKIRDDLVPKVEVIVDSSGSMAQLLDKDKSKMYYTKKILNKYLTYQWKKKALVGMRVYGSRRKEDCSDNYLSIPFGERNLSKIQKQVMLMSPIGMTPLHKSISDAIKDLKDYEGKKSIVIFTDGNETCGGDPCELVEEVNKNKDVKIEFYVVAIGFDETAEEYEGVSCLGETTNVNNESQLNSAVSSISKKVHTMNNLEVHSPKEDAMVVVYKWEGSERKYYKSFIAKNGTRVPHGIYDVEVRIQPVYQFKRFQLNPWQKKHLVVRGNGKVRVNFTKNLMNVELLDKNMKVVHKLNSDKDYLAKTGKYNLKLSKPPYYSLIIPNFYIFPNGNHVHDADGAAAIQFNHEITSGYYIYNNKDELVGNYITNVPLVLKTGTYRFFMNDDCFIKSKNVNAEKTLQTISCEDGKKQ